jgi:hypothetical protein
MLGKAQRSFAKLGEGAIVGDQQDSPRVPPLAREAEVLAHRGGQVGILRGNYQ